MIKDVSNKRKLIRISVMIAVVLILIIGIFAVFSYIKYRNEQNKNENIHFFRANYNEDIFQNKAYMSFQRDLLYGISGVEQIFTYDDYDEASAECKFFLSYFKTVIHGDYTGYTDFFVDNYFENEPKFTMQMIYDPYVKYHSTSTDIFDDKEVTLLNFQVSYKIFRNNGTFRNDVPSNTAVPQIYQLIKTDNGSLKIYRILAIEEEK